MLPLPVDTRLLAIVKLPVKASAVKPPLIVDAPRMKVLLSVSETFLPEITETVLKSLVGVVSVMSLLPAFKDVMPLTESAPVCEIAAVLIALKVLAVITGNVNADETL